MVCTSNYCICIIQDSDRESAISEEEEEEEEDKESSDVQKRKRDERHLGSGDHEPTAKEKAFLYPNDTIVLEFEPHQSSGRRFLRERLKPNYLSALSSVCFKQYFRATKL